MSDRIGWCRSSQGQPVVFGTEVEYAAQATVGDEHDPMRTAAEVAHRVVEAATRCLPRLPDGTPGGWFLGNGARCYVDNTHIEYATPECDDPFTLAVAELAGDVLLARPLLQLGDVEVYKNNCDGGGRIYGYHENYSLSEQADIGRLELALVPYLATRTVLSGSGSLRFSAESGERAWNVRFELSQRHEGLARRAKGLHGFGIGLVVKSGPSGRRLHVALGDSLRSATAIALTVGATALIVGSPESFLDLGVCYAPANPFAAFASASSWAVTRTPIRLHDGRFVCPLQIQQAYAERASTLAAAPPWRDRLVNRWCELVQQVGDRWHLAATSLDGYLKLALVLAELKRAGVPFDDALAILGDGSIHDSLRPAVECTRRVLLLTEALHPAHDLRAVLVGEGVLDSAATPAAATIESALVDSAGVARSRARAGYVRDLAERADDAGRVGSARARTTAQWHQLVGPTGEVITLPPLGATAAW